MADPSGGAPSGVRRGPFQAGERITLHDPKGRRHSVVLAQGAAALGHDHAGRPAASVAVTFPGSDVDPGDLAGIAGTATIVVSDAGEHVLELDYELG